MSNELQKHASAVSSKLERPPEKGSQFVSITDVNNPTHKSLENVYTAFARSDIGAYHLSAMKVVEETEIKPSRGEDDEGGGSLQDFWRAEYTAADHELEKVAQRTESDERLKREANLMSASFSARAAHWYGSEPNDDAVYLAYPGESRQKVVTWKDLNQGGLYKGAHTKWCPRSMPCKWVRFTLTTLKNLYFSTRV